MRWKAHFFLEGVNSIDIIDNSNLKLKKKCPPICKDTQAFENDHTDMVKNIKFTKHNYYITRKLLQLLENKS